MSNLKKILQKKQVIIFLICFIIINLFWTALIEDYFEKTFPEITGMGVTGTIALLIEGKPGHITIDSPQNTTYNFSIGDNYTIDLNVSADFDVETWTYTLISLKNGSIIYEDVGFTPNTTFNAVRWSNKLIVNASGDGKNASDSVVFFVYVPNSAPIIGDVDPNIYVCEGDYLSYYFNATDVDGDDLYSDISPKNPFYVFPVLWHADGMTCTVFEIISGTLDKDDVGGVNNGWKVYEETIAISDGMYSDYAHINITVIEINNPPSIENIGVQTIYTRGENSTFYKQVKVNDIEDGNQDSGNLGFNISFSNNANLFNITQNGVMNFTPNESQVGVYNITVCVNDTGIDNPFEGILGNCSQDGGPMVSCIDFSLTITDENRAPTITSYYPLNESLNVSGTDRLYFNITKYDPDGTIPDAYWYVDNVLREYDSGSSTDEFSYSFGCGISGDHVIKVEITDGLENDSIEWNVSVSYVECPVGVVSGGGGVGGCRVKWVCGDWGVCQNAKKSLEAGILSGEDYRTIQKQCLENNLDEKTCGFQIRKCFDLNNCNTSILKPAEIQFCHYVEKPSCFDGVKNCHDGACEILIDCGGPCPPCPSCSDKIQNQGEEGVDCGGPCPPCIEIPRKKPTTFVIWILISLIFVLLITITIILINIFRIRNRIRKK